MCVCVVCERERAKCEFCHVPYEYEEIDCNSLVIVRKTHLNRLFEKFSYRFCVYCLYYLVLRFMRTVRVWGGGGEEGQTEQREPNDQNGRTRNYRSFFW